MSYKGVIFEKETDYLKDAKTAKEQINRCEQIINALELAALDAATNEGVESYSLDDGQVKINKSYRSVREISKAIIAFERHKQNLINQQIGRVSTLMHSGNFRAGY